MDAPLDLFRAKVSPSARLLCAYLWRFARPGKERAWPSNETICSDLGISRRTAQRLVKECTEAGLLWIGKTPEGPNGFHLDVDNDAPDMAQGAPDMTQAAPDMAHVALLSNLKIELEDTQKDLDSEKPKKKKKKRREQTDKAWSAYIETPHKDQPTLVAHLKGRFPAYDGLHGRLSFEEVLNAAKRWWKAATPSKAWIDPSGLITWFSRDYQRVRWSFEKDNLGTGNTTVPTLRPDGKIRKGDRPLFEKSERVDQAYRDQLLSVVRGGAK